jgi:hypothetical protein
MEDGRGFIRFFSQLKARYITEDKEKDWKECTIINVNRKGMGVKFNTRERINEGSTILFEISVPSELEPVQASGILKWINEGANYFVGGIEFPELLDEDTFAKLG